ncbi:unnamed protein product [Sordaria macrospora k-hell]|uniref:WGS project CABT00000000 data, contig 2.15 n=1 Tax=Sordaria macrospora (strain ATCC MYA-333 / DSM 997 / K(L3346) / K-hell) TaxID=771870 RepID=F7VZL6_SORMK|nr:uncharacterized protein SMAC_04193 [Sordaria macrospora k-hell]CCC10964.1 unnamed protein product [Sordaria macrospora k-hell]
MAVLLRDINEGDCVEFAEEEEVPVEVVSAFGGPEGYRTGVRKGSLQHVQQVVTGHVAGFGLGQGGSAGEKPTAVEDRVTLADQPAGMVFTRRRVPLIGSKEQQSGGQEGTAGYASMMMREDFLREVVAIRCLNLHNEHLARYFASYTHLGNGYMLFTPATTEHTFKSILSSGTLPSSVKHLEKGQQRRLVMNWIHCLVDTVCWLHSKGLAHGAVKPSNIFLAEHNNLPVLADFHTRTNPTGPVTDKGQAQHFDKEAYDYAAPELARFNLAPRITFMAIPSYLPGAELPSALPSSPTSSQTHHLQALQEADIFALSCIILDILSFLVFKKQNGVRAFAAHRAANPKHKTSGRGGALPDSSFHRNLDQVKSWMAALVRAAEEKVAVSKKKKHTFGGIGSKLHFSGVSLHMGLGHGHGHGASGSSSSDEGSDHGYGEKKDALEGVGMMVKVMEGMLNPDPTQRKTALEVQGGTYLALREGCGIDEPHCVHGHGPSPLGRLTTKTPSPTRTPKQTTPTPSMYGGRMRSNSAISMTSGSPSAASTSFPVPGLGSRSFSISDMASASRWSHSTSSRSSTSSSSFGFPHGFFSSIGGGQSHSRGNSHEYKNGQPRQRRTSSRASGPKQLLTVPSSMSSATLSLPTRPRTATPTASSASTITQHHQQHQQPQPRASVSTSRGMPAPRSQSSTRAQSQSRNQSRCGSRTRGDHHQDGNGNGHGHGQGDGEAGHTIWKRILYAGSGNGTVSSSGSHGDNNNNESRSGSISSHHHPPEAATPATTPAPAAALVHQSSASKLAGRLKRKPEKATAKATANPRGVGGGVSASSNYRRMSRSSSQTSLTSLSLTKSWRERRHGSGGSGTALFGVSAAGS